MYWCRVWVGLCKAKERVSESAARSYLGSSALMDVAAPVVASSSRDRADCRFFVLFSCKTEVYTYILARG
jgi:hypothetical protein